MIGQVLEKERFLGRALARTTEVLATSMPSGYNAGNGHMRTGATPAVQFLKAETAPDKLALLAISKPEADQWPRERLKALTPLIQYAYSSPWVGIRQKMPDGWSWPNPQK